MSITHLPSGEGKSFWVSNNEFVTLKTTGKAYAGSTNARAAEALVSTPRRRTVGSAVSGQ
jgi:hypothetical protein